MNKCVRPSCEYDRLARGLCARHYKKAHNAKILPVSQKMSSPLVDATGSRRRIQDLLLLGHTSEEIASRVGITPMEIRRIFAGGRLRVRESVAGAITSAHYVLEGTQGTSGRTANWAKKQGYVRIDQYLDPENPRSRARRTKVGTHG